jgi:hypothetical protein
MPTFSLEMGKETGFSKKLLKEMLNSNLTSFNVGLTERHQLGFESLHGAFGAC